jgi:predicted ATPase
MRQASSPNKGTRSAKGVTVRVSALSWTRYRSFKERQRVEVAPVTLIIGRNGSGKSVISRLPLLLASGVDEDAIDPLDLSAGGVEHAATYQDLVHSRSRLPFSLGAEVAGGNNSFEFETSLRYVSERRNLAVETFWLSRRGTRFLQATLSDESQLRRWPKSNESRIVRPGWRSPRGFLRRRLFSRLVG